jgi:hypothetical protein
LTVYNELNQKFLQFYEQDVKAMQKSIASTRLWLFVIEPLVCIALAFIFKSNIILCLVVIYALFSVKRVISFDKAIKLKLMPKLCSALEPLVVLLWENSNEKDFKYFQNLYSEHNLFKLNEAHFEANDSFIGKFNGVEFEVNEITNKPNVWRTFTTIFASFFLAVVIPSFLSSLVLTIVFLIISQLFGIKSLSGAPVVYLLTISFILPAIIMAYKFIKVSPLKLSIKVLDIFKGAVVCFNFDKVKEGHTIIFENDIENVLVKSMLTSDFQKVELEDVEFNKVFSVYTTNQIEARYALTTAMMERLLRLKMDFKSKYIRASFKNGKLLLAIQSDKDLFRLGTVLPRSNKKVCDEMFTELVSILKVTDALHLNSDTGL